MDEAWNRWALPDWHRTCEWCQVRNRQGIWCIIDVLGENASTEDRAEQSVHGYRRYIRAIRDQGLKASISVKLTDLGALSDRKLGQRNARQICREAKEQGVGFEIDMEGKPLVQFTLETALACVQDGPVTLAVQAYLDRSADDLQILLQNGVKPRLVKGAYLGDVEDFQEIQNRLKALVETAFQGEQPFDLSTHDPQIVEWARTRFSMEDGITFSFLKGLSDETKLELAREGQSISEYVPFGPLRGPYQARRLRYLRQLEEMGRRPAP